MVAAVHLAHPDIGVPAVSLRNVSLTFDTERGRVNALGSISVDIEQGSFVSLLGPSGCGKSTTLRLVADLLDPTSGEVEVLGHEAARARRARELGFVFQDAALLPWRTAIQNVSLPLEVGGGGAAAGAATPAELLALVGLEGRENAYPHELSGGMRQRVAIARALVCQPRILLMDEPFGALDEITRDRLNEELLQIWKRTGVTVLFVTHSIPEAAYLSERVLVFSAHPGAIQAAVDIDLPQPRTPSVRDTDQFSRLCIRLRHELGAKR